MKFTCKTEQLSDGQWRARSTSAATGTVEVKAPTRDEVLNKIRRELHYRLELCPCTGETYKDIEIELVDG